MTIAIEDVTNPVTGEKDKVHISLKNLVMTLKYGRVDAKCNLSDFNPKVHVECILPIMQEELATYKFLTRFIWQNRKQLRAKPTLQERTVSAYGEITLNNKTYHVDLSLVGQKVLVNTATLEAYKVFQLNETEPVFKMFEGKTITMRELQNNNQGANNESKNI